MNIRLFDYNSDDDYQQVVELHNAIWPDEMETVIQWKHWDSRQDPKCKRQRYVLELDSRPVAFGGYSQSPWSYDPAKFYVGVNVHPQYRRQGLGAAFFAHLLEALQPHTPSLLVASTREDQPESLSFLEQRGFKKVMRFPHSDIDSSQFEATPFLPVVERVLASGIEIKTLSQLMVEDSDYKQKLYDLDWEATQDEPSPQPLTEPGFENYDTHVFNNPDLLPDGWFVAIDKGYYAGLTQLWLNPATEGRLHVGFTGVRRAYRRRGICTALKVKAIEYARLAHGGPILRTGNEENNPMYQINLRLGFVPQPAWLDFEKVL